MIIFSNTTPFIALASIGQLDLMPKLFGKIHVASAVIEECAEAGRILVPNLRNLEWIIPVNDIQANRLPILFELDRGEKQTTELALARKAEKVIMIERLATFLDLISKLFQLSPKPRRSGRERRNLGSRDGAAWEHPCNLDTGDPCRYDE